MLVPKKSTNKAKKERITSMRGILRGTGVGTETLLKEREKELEQGHGFCTVNRFR